MCDFLSCNNILIKQLDEFIDSVENKDNALIEVLHYAQGLFGYLPKEIQLYIAKTLDIPPSKVYGVVSFYTYFTTEPIGKYKISVCLGKACFVKGSDKILEEFEKELGIKVGQSTKDLKFSLEGLRCAGACGLAPVITINGKVHGKVKPEDVKDIINYYKNLD